MKVFLIGIGGGLGLHVAQQLTARGERGMDEAFEHYMVAKKHAESELGLTDLDRIILRASALTNESGKGRADFGLAKVHKETSRDGVAATIVELLRRPETYRTILEVTTGTLPISDAVAALRP